MPCNCAVSCQQLPLNRKCACVELGVFCTTNCHKYRPCLNKSAHSPLAETKVTESDSAETKTTKSDLACTASAPRKGGFGLAAQTQLHHCCSCDSQLLPAAAASKKCACGQYTCAKCTSSVPVCGSCKLLIGCSKGGRRCNGARCINAACNVCARMFFVGGACSACAT
jgi:hypothetical protein